MGQRVQIRFRDHHWWIFSGNIERVHEGGKAAVVKMDDGDMRLAVPKGRIRLLLDENRLPVSNYKKPVLWSPEMELEVLFHTATDTGESCIVDSK